MSKSLAVVLNDLLSRKRAAALRREMERPASERKDAAVVVNEVMEDWLLNIRPRLWRTVTLRSKGDC